MNERASVPGKKALLERADPGRREYSIAGRVRFIDRSIRNRGITMEIKREIICGLTSGQIE